MSGMVTIPVSMYQTVVTNMGEGVPITMQTVCSTADSGTNSGTTVIQVESAQQQVANNTEQQHNNQKVIYFCFF